MNTPPTVTAQEWNAAREQLLVKEKSLTRARDALAGAADWMDLQRARWERLFDVVEDYLNEKES